LLLQAPILKTNYLTNKMSLSLAAITSSKRLTVSLAFRDGISFDIAYLSRAKLQDIYKKSQKVDYNPATKTREQMSDPDKFAKLFVEACVLGWNGVTPKSIASHVQIDEAILADEKKANEPIPYTPENMFFLLRNAYEIDTFLQEAVGNLEVFAPGKEEAEKNSSSSQSGS
jgi:hypothetical protein